MLSCKAACTIPDIKNCEVAFCHATYWEKSSLCPKNFCNVHLRCHREVRSTTRSLKACFPLFFNPFLLPLLLSLSLSVQPALFQHISKQLLYVDLAVIGGMCFNMIYRLALRASRLAINCTIFRKGSFA